MDNVRTRRPSSCSHSLGSQVWKRADMSYCTVVVTGQALILSTAAPVLCSVAADRCVTLPMAKKSSHKNYSNGAHHRTTVLYCTVLYRSCNRAETVGA
ncbi:hypothetical protein BCV70DRAFT_198872 [Testicularia cyperi]|uniref:Uncharacterized protein n=1 Tax=Testicularia cyperi TaxID=1882483 RepID=A0A317XSV4_9BASI|nr:hypothetical protein BCV70DRAFT_198872 [Testicularia cyperi]